jgi:hypothetical protein
LLPNPALKPVYDEVIWVYVYRDFTSRGQDRDAERVSWRFGVTSWPQLFLADPRTLAILTHTGREPESFLAAVRRTSVDRDDSPEALAALAEAEQRADELERTRSVGLARYGIDDEDIVVRYLSLRILADRAPKEVVARARELLHVPNDPFRYEVCDVLKAERAASAKEALEALVADPADSLNPNVLRIRAVGALAECGDAGSISAIAPHASSGAWNNGLTGLAVDALAAIGKRHRDARADVRAVLRRSYPDPAGATDDRAKRACVGLAKRVHAALGERGPFPDPYDAAARERLMRN